MKCIAKACIVALLIAGGAWSCKKGSAPPAQAASAQLPYGNFPLLLRDFSLYIDSKGVKWIGYTGGVLRYDGSGWTQYTSGNTGVAMDTMIPQTDDADGGMYFVSSLYGHSSTIVKVKNNVCTAYAIPLVSHDSAKLFFNASDGNLYLWASSGTIQSITKFSPSVDFSQGKNVTVIYYDTSYRGYLYYSDCAFVSNTFYVCGGNEITEVSTAGSLLLRLQYVGLTTDFDKVICSFDKKVYVTAGTITGISQLFALQGTSFLHIPWDARTYVPYVTVDASNVVFAVDVNGSAYKLVNGALLALPTGASGAIAVDKNNVKWIATNDYLTTYRD